MRSRAVFTEEPNMAKKRYAGEYAGKAARDGQESRDGGMIMSGSGIANMPQEVMYKPWPSSPYGMNSSLDDSITGIDNQMRSDSSSAKSHMKPHKW